MMEENKRTTAPVSSVAADVGQSQINDSTIISDKQQKDNLYTEKNTEDMQQLVRKMQQMQNPNYLHMIGIEDLMDMTFQVRQTVIENLLHKGVYLFAGAPKIGKSFLVLQIAYAVSTGQAFCGYDVKQGAVLYLALEDQYQRLQERMARMFGVESQGELLLAVNAKQIGLGLEGQMEYFLKQYPSARLVWD